MKKVITIFIIASLCAAFCGCGAADERSVLSAESTVPASDALSEEYSGVVYTTREDGDDGTYTLRDYTDSGRLLRERVYANGVLYAEAFYDSNGTQTGAVYYTENGEVDYRLVCSTEANRMIEVSTNSDGSFREKNVYIYGKSQLVDMIIEYNEKDERVFETIYKYDDSSRLKVEQGFLYNGAVMTSSYVYHYDVTTGEAVKLEQVNCDANGAFINHEVYELIGDEMNLIERYDGEGNPLPLD